MISENAEMAIAAKEPKLASPPSLFDFGLPREVIEHILRFISARPAVARPECFTDPADVLTLLDSSTLMRAAARNRFSDISTVARSRTPAGLFVDYERRHLLADLVRGMGEDLRALCVGDVNKLELDWVDALSHHATSVVDLSLHGVDATFPLDAVLGSCGGSLRRLALQFVGCASIGHLDCVAERASSVTALELRGVSVTGGFSHIWGRLHCVEDLTITTHGRLRGTCSDIYHHIAHPTSRVRRLALGELNFDVLELAAELCEQFAGRLSELSFELPLILSGSTDELARIKAACPNASIRMACLSQYIPTAVRELRDSLLELRTTEMCLLNALSDDLGDCAHMCTRLRSVTLHLCDLRASAFLEQLLVHVGHRLTFMHIHVAPDQFSQSLVSGTPQHFALIARHTGSLEHLVVEQLIPFASLEPVAIANPHLRSLRILVNNQMLHLLAEKRHFVGEWIVGLVRHFLSSCPQLEDIVVDDSFLRGSHLLQRDVRIIGLDELCASFCPRRKVGVQVGNSYYEK